MHLYYARRGQGCFKSSGALTVPIGEVSATPSSSKTSKNEGLAALLLIAMSSPALLVSII